MRKLFSIGIPWLVAGHLFAGSIPAQITYQGTLKQRGVPANGIIQMEFQIINLDNSITYWNSQPINVPVTQGLFSQLLNPQNTLNPQNPLDWENTTPYIQVTINPTTQPVTLAPAEPITTTMFSLVAATVVDASVSTQKIADGAVTQQKLAASIGIVPAGTIVAYGGINDPPGWLICDGREVNRTTFASMFSAVGVAFGSGNGTTTFNIPDFRGRFLRGQNQSTGRDPDSSTRTTMSSGGNPGDAIGSVQSQQIIAHAHTINDPGHNHNLPVGEGQFGLIRRSVAGEPNTVDSADATDSGNQPDLSTTPSSIIPNSTTGITINSFGGSETRPINAYVNWIIRS
jgi:microcystin-dependent protein